jgi:hypothetical protein
MRESTYNSILANKIEKEIGGRVIKLSDRSTLGLPDSIHILRGGVTFIEVKVCKTQTCKEGKVFVSPWNCIKDLRQYEMCRSLSRYALMLYAIYWPRTKMTAVLSIDALEALRPSELNPRGLDLMVGSCLREGHGIDMIKERIEEARKLYAEKY